MGYIRTPNVETGMGCTSGNLGGCNLMGARHSGSRYSLLLDTQRKWSARDLFNAFSKAAELLNLDPYVYILLYILCRTKKNGSLQKTFFLHTTVSYLCTPERTTWVTFSVCKIMKHFYLKNNIKETVVTQIDKRSY